MRRVKGLYPAPLHLLIISDAERAVKIDGMVGPHLSKPHNPLSAEYANT